MKSSQVKKKIIIHSECIIDFRGRLSLSTMMYIMPIQTRPILHLLHNPGQNGEPQTREAIYLIFSFLWFDLAIYKIKCLLYLDER